MQLPTEMVIYVWYIGTTLEWATLCLCYYNKLSDAKVEKSSSSIIKHTAHNKADTSLERNETFLT